MRCMRFTILTAAVIGLLAALGAAGAVPRAPELLPGSVAATAADEEEAAPQEHEPPPDEPYEADPVQADEYFTGGTGPPVYSRPSHSFGGEFERCEDRPTEPGIYEWDGCDPFEEGEADYYHYDKPYGESLGDAMGFLLWEPGRFERAGFTFWDGRGYYQSDRWSGPVSWDDAGYWDPATGCGGYYASNVRIRVPGQDVPLPLPFPVATPDIEQPVPGAEDGFGGQACLPMP